jgi:hypothetical protein
VTDDLLRQLRDNLALWREEARAAFHAERRARWPDVDDDDYAAVVRALGDISVDDARAALARLQRDARERRG